MVTAEIIERIKRLLAMRDGAGASSTEAEVAAAKVRQLLDAHGLTLAELQALGKEKTAVEWHELQHEFRRPPPWVKYLLLQVSIGFDCRTVKSLDGYLAVVGFEQDAAVALYLFGVLRRELEAAATAAAKARGCRGKWLRHFRESFLLAAARRIGERLRDARRVDATTTGLIACKKSLVEQALPPRSSGTGASLKSGMGANCGHAFGDRVHLGTDGIESKAAAPLALGHSVRESV